MAKNKKNEEAVKPVSDTYDNAADSKLDELNAENEGDGVGEEVATQSNQIAVAKDVYEKAGVGTPEIKNDKLVAFHDKEFGTFKFEGTRFEKSDNPVGSARRAALLNEQRANKALKKASGYDIKVDKKSLANIVNETSSTDKLSDKEKKQLGWAQTYEDANYGTMVTDKRGALTGFDDKLYGRLTFKNTNYSKEDNPISKARTDASNEKDKLDKALKENLHLENQVIDPSKMGPRVSQQSRHDFEYDRANQKNAVPQQPRNPISSDSSQFKASGNETPRWRASQESQESRHNGADNKYALPNDRPEVSKTQETLSTKREPEAKSTQEILSTKREPNAKAQETLNIKRESQESRHNGADNRYAVPNDRPEVSKTQETLSIKRESNNDALNRLYNPGTKAANLIKNDKTAVPGKNHVAYGKPGFQSKFDSAGQPKNDKSKNKPTNKSKDKDFDDDLEL